MAVINKKSGFILPTVLMTSLVMFFVLLSSISATVAIRTALAEQYYYKLAKTAAEAGLTMAQACLEDNSGEQPWANQLVTGVSCDGVKDTDFCDIDNSSKDCAYVARDEKQKLRTKYKVTCANDGCESGAPPTSLLITGETQLFNKNKDTWRQYFYYLKADIDSDGYTILRTY